MDASDAVVFGQHGYATAGDQGGTGHPSFDAIDLARIGAMCEILSTTTIDGLLAEVFDGVEDAANLIDSLGRYCRFDHGALLVFPRSFDSALAALPAFGAYPGAMIPSVIVKSRLSKRYGIPPEELDVRLTHATLSGTGEKKIELFMLGRSAAVPDVLVDRERSLNLESHVALYVPEPDPVVVQGLRWVLREQAGFSWDGGGYNPHENSAAGGTSVLYFLRSTRDGTGAVRRRRLEVKFTGDYSYLTRTHVDTGTRRPARGPIPTQRARQPADPAETWLGDWPHRVYGSLRVLASRRALARDPDAHR